MTDLVTIVLQSETALPMEITGWVVLALSLIITLVWLAYVYR